MIIRKRTTKIRLSACSSRATKKPTFRGRLSCICKIVRRSRALQRVTADFVCKGTQFFVNPCNVPRTYLLDARFVL